MNKKDLISYVRYACTWIAEVDISAYRQMAPQMLRAVLAFIDEDEANIDDCGLRACLWQATEHALALSRGKEHLHPDFQKRNENTLIYYYEMFENAIQKWYSHYYAEANTARVAMGLPPLRET